MAHFLLCIECGALTNEFVYGWRGYLIDEEYEPAEVAILCPTCSEREFGSPRRSSTDHPSDASD